MLDFPAMTTTMPDVELAPRIGEVVKRYWGYDALRPLQLEAIMAGLEHRDSLVVLPTGGGKSLCYQVPPEIAGRTDIVVSPLISLMKDQVDALRACGYPAAAFHSGLSESERREVASGVLAIVDGDNGEMIGLVAIEDLLDRRHFLLAGVAPGRPEIQVDGPAAKIREPQASAVVARKLEVRREITGREADFVAGQGRRRDRKIGRPERWRVPGIPAGRT